MTAGQPNWQKLYEMGKLPKSARGSIPMLQQLDVAEEKIKKLEAEVKRLTEGGPETPVIAVETPKIDSQTIGEIVQVRCEVEGCVYMASGKSEAQAKRNLGLHMRTHEVKKEE